jgi:hypothetical protein
MIKTQLCPSGELENKNWWHLDVVVLILVAVLSYVLLENYFDEMRAKVVFFQENKTRFDQQYASRQAGLEKFKSLNAEIELLNRKIGALKRITTSKVDKIRPLMALDQLQTLWMEGVWYESIDYSADGAVGIKGSAHDSILVGEYMLGVKETMNPDTRNDDLRTQIGFDSVALRFVKLLPGGDEIFPDIKKKMQFEITASHVEKQALPSQSADVTLGPRPRALGPTFF